MIATMNEHPIDSTSSDRVAPTITRAEVSAIHRGQGPKKEGCSGYSASSCDDLGSVRLRVQGADETTPPEELGWSLELESGALPAGVRLPATPVRAVGGELWFSFLDGDTDDQEAFSFTLRVASVDAAGNKSSPVLVAVAHEGSGSCAFGRSGVRWGWGVFVALAALTWRRLRRPSVGAL